MTAFRVFPCTSWVLHRFLSALQQNRAQSRLLYLLNIIGHISLLWPNIIIILWLYFNRLLYRPKPLIFKWEGINKQGTSTNQFLFHLFFVHSFEISELRFNQWPEMHAVNNNHLMTGTKRNSKLCFSENPHWSHRETKLTVFRGASHQCFVIPHNSELEKTMRRNRTLYARSIILIENPCNPPRIRTFCWDRRAGIVHDYSTWVWFLTYFREIKNNNLHLA